MDSITEAAETKAKHRAIILCEKRRQTYNFFYIAEVLNGDEFAEYVRSRDARGYEIVGPANAITVLARQGNLEGMKAVLEVHPVPKWSLRTRKLEFPKALECAGGYGRLEMFDFLADLIGEVRTEDPEVWAELDIRPCHGLVENWWLSNVSMAFLVDPHPYGAENITAELHDRYLAFRLPWDPEQGFPTPVAPWELETIDHRIRTAYISSYSSNYKSVEWESTARFLRGGPPLPLDMLVRNYDKMETYHFKKDPHSPKYPVETFAALQVAVAKSLEAFGAYESVDAELLLRAVEIVDTPAGNLPGYASRPEA